MARPPVMNEADRLFNRLTAPTDRKSIVEMQTLLSKLSTELQKVRPKNLASFWESFEKDFNGGRKITVQGKTDEAKLLTAFSLMYNVMNTADPLASGTRQYTAMRNQYYDTRDHLERWFSTQLSSKDKRTMNRIVNTIDSRLINVVKHHNKRVDAGEIQGPKVSVPS
jgi:hypothetical protein